MLNDRRTEILNVLSLIGHAARRLQAMEDAGELTREQAQAQAIKALAKLREGDRLYVWARTTDGVGLVHPLPGVVGNIDRGVVRSNGLTTFDNYLAVLKDTDKAVFEDLIPKPGHGPTPVPKLNGALLLHRWNWVIGYGVFIDDVHEQFMSYLWEFLWMALAVIVAIGGLTGLTARRIMSTLGGDPEEVTRVARAISTGDLTQKIEPHGAPDSLLNTTAVMQQELRTLLQNMTETAATAGLATDHIAMQMKGIRAVNDNAAAIQRKTIDLVERLAALTQEPPASRAQREIHADLTEALLQVADLVRLNASAYTAVDNNTKVLLHLVNRQNAVISKFKLN